MRLRSILAVLLLVPGTAFAQPSTGDDGYCDYVEGTAAANAATLVAPTVFGQFGYIEQPSFSPTPSTDPSNLRVLGGVRYSLTNIFAGSATKSRAAADCRRHNALKQLQALQGIGRSLRDATQAQALTARVQVFDEAMGEADRILKDTLAQLEARQTTAQQATATRLRVEELRTLAANAKRELAELPPVEEQKPLPSLLTAFRVADADVEKAEAKLRTLRAYDISVRAGVDRFLEGVQETRYFAVAELSVNLGALWLGSGNKRARAGRSRYAVAQHELLGRDVTSEQVRAALDLEIKRIEQTQALVADLKGQLDSLAQMQGDDARRFREVVWFDYIKAKAELAYLQAHVQAARTLLGLK